MHHRSSTWWTDDLGQGLTAFLILTLSLLLTLCVPLLLVRLELQVEYLVDGLLPEDLSQGLVFSNQELKRLKQRIDVSVA